MSNEIKLNEFVEFEPDTIWTCKTDLRFLWIPIGARMTVIKFPDNKLFVHSPVGLTEKMKAQLSDMGQIRYNRYLSRILFPVVDIHCLPGETDIYRVLLRSKVQNR